MKKTLFLVSLSLILTCISCHQEDTSELNNTSNPVTMRLDNATGKQEKYSISKLSSGQKKFLLVHGAWHPEGIWSKMVIGLENLGHEVYTVQLPGLGTDKTPLDQISLSSHVQAVTDKMQSIGSGITLVGHSYGGVVISQAAENYSILVDRVVYLSAFMLEDGESLLDWAAADTNSKVTQNIIVTGDSVFIPETAYEDAFYNFGMNSNNPTIEEDIYFAKTLLVPHPFVTFTSTVSLGSAYDALEKVYISCTDDQAITPQAQYDMYSRFTGLILYTIQNADHSPFISRPNQVINILKNL